MTTRNTTARRPGAGNGLASGRLTRLRTGKLLSREELARTAGISLSALSKIENGERRPRMTTLRSLCDALGCRPEDLLADG